jgi:HEPN domain-containing protein
MQSETVEWIMQAEYDLGTAQAMFEAERYIYCVYMCHLAVEKILKAIVVETTKETPPKTHNLIYLLKLCKVKLSESQVRFITRLNTAAVATRYPDELKMLIEQYSPAVAESYLKNARDVVKCLKQQVS